MHFTHYQITGGKVFAVNQYEKPMFTGSAYDGVSNWSAFNDWAAHQPPITADPSIKDGVYKVDELEIVWQYEIAGEPGFWFSSRDQSHFKGSYDQYRSYMLEIGAIDTRIYGTLKQPVKQEEKDLPKQEYKGEEFDDINGAWDWHSRGIPETVYSCEELEYIMGEQIMLKSDFEESAKALIKKQSILFLEWINNNWFIPANDGFWKLDVENIEYQRTIPKKDVDIFDTEELFTMFLNNEGEL